MNYWRRQQNMKVQDIHKHRPSCFNPSMPVWQQALWFGQVPPIFPACNDINKGKSPYIPLVKPTCAPSTGEARPKDHTCASQPIIINKIRSDSEATTVLSHKPPNLWEHNTAAARVDCFIIVSTRQWQHQPSLQPRMTTIGKHDNRDWCF